MILGTELICLSRTDAGLRRVLDHPSAMARLHAASAGTAAQLLQPNLQALYGRRRAFSCSLFAIVNGANC
jgi:hypothetical protein